MKKDFEQKKISNDEKLAERVIDLCLWYQIEDSNNMIRIFESEIKMYETEKQLLLNNCILGFKSKKVNKKIEEIDKNIFRLCENISKEITMIEKMESSLTGIDINCKNKESDYFDGLISYYNLLSYLKYNITFREIALCKFDKEVSYIYDGNNYILKNKKNANDQFELFLSDCDSDSSKLIKNIKIIKV